MPRVALIGCGNIGRILARHGAGLEITAVHDAEPGRAEALAGETGAVACPDVTALLRQAADVVVEAASIDAARHHAETIVAHGRDLVLLSVGALADVAFRDRLLSRARAAGVRIHIPSGAIGGLDALNAARVAGLHSLTLRTTKRPAALGVDVDAPTRVFSGPASVCIRDYPRNVNVAVSLSLAAGRDADVELWADPAVTGNVHEVVAEGEFGKLQLRLDNVACPDNPRTSYLAALSVIALLRGFDQALTIGG
jgi:aspartate dehydrogenase